MIATIDDKGRLLIPKRERDALGLGPGDAVFIERDGETLRLARAENPFDGLARHAIKEYEAGRTRGLRDIMRELGMSPDAVALDDSE